MDTMREPIKSMDPLRLFLLNEGIPVEYELDKFNTPHKFISPQKLAM